MNQNEKENEIEKVQTPMKSKNSSESNNKSDGGTPGGDEYNSVNLNNNEIIKETPLRKKIIEPQASPMFNVYGKDMITPNPVTPNDVEVIVEKPKEDEDKEVEEEIPDKKDINKNKDNNLNKNNDNNNEANHKLIYTHLNPQIIDSTKVNNSVYNPEEEEEFINEGTFNQDKFKQDANNKKIN